MNKYMVCTEIGDYEVTASCQRQACSDVFAMTYGRCGRIVCVRRVA